MRFTSLENRRSGRMAASTSSSPSQQSRFAEFVKGVPLVTLIVMLVCVVVYIADNLGDFSANMALFSISPYMVLTYAQVYRIITAAFTHGGIMHIGMNMMSLYQLGSGLVCTILQGCSCPVTYLFGAGTPVWIAAILFYSSFVYTLHWLTVCLHGLGAIIL
jgi:membrane associated rhomboid family serine protease